MTFQITPTEIENVIESISGVETVAVVGIPDSKAGNLTAAVVIKRHGFENLTEHEIASTVAEKLQFFKHLYGGVYFVDEVPTNLNGKIIRSSVRELAIAKRKNRYKE